MRPLYGLLTALLWTTMLQGQQSHIAVTQHTGEGFSIKLFDHHPLPFSQSAKLFKARTHDLAVMQERLTVSGNFRDSRVRELALFGDLGYTPNMSPHYTNTVVQVFRSSGYRMEPLGTWYNEADSLIRTAYINFATAGDFNADQLDDIALFYNDPNSEEQIIYVLESTPEGGFASPKIYFSTTRNEFNFTAIDFVCTGNFAGNKRTDIAVFYNYFGNEPTTKQAIFLFESQNSTLQLKDPLYSSTKSEIDFSDINFALAGDYNSDDLSDIAILQTPLPGQDQKLLVFEGSETGALLPVNYLSSPELELEFFNISHALSGQFAGDQNSDLLLLCKDTTTGVQRIQILEGNTGSFLPPEEITDSPLQKIPFEEITSLQEGKFLNYAVARVTTWPNGHKGAISFTFDDGTYGAFANGARALDSANLTGTFYVFTDTTIEYDAPLAGTALMQLYHEKGFEIASHTRNHTNLGLIGAQNPDSLSAVLTQSKQELDDRFSQKTMSLSIPFGSFRQESLDSISKHFYTARSSQFGFNLEVPYDYYALRSWPILSTTSPEYVDNLVSIAETYGTFLPLMYHDILAESFNEEDLIYSYSLGKFEETIRLCKERDVWIDTHARIYKYMRERETLQIEELIPTGEDGSFSLILHSPLPDSVFDVALTFHIDVPTWWKGQTAISVGDSLWQFPILGADSASYILFNQVPVEGREIFVSEWTPNSLAPETRSEAAALLSLSASPNPFHQDCFIGIEGTTSEQAQLILMDMQGSILRTLETKGKKRIRISGKELPPGMYIVGLLGSQGDLAYIKLLKQ